jgi:outer membrane PBP1 activator LpoA protein
MKVVKQCLFKAILRITLSEKKMKSFYTLFFIILAVTLNACSSLPPTVLPTPVALPTPQTDSNRLPTGAEVQRANALLKQGKRRDAAKEYFNAAQKYRSPDKERLILQAAELATLISDRSLTQIYLSALGRQLNTANLARYRYIQGQLAILDGEHKKALNLLPKNVKNLPRGLQQKILNARLRTAQASGDKVMFAMELVIQEYKLKQPQQIKLNHERIWNQINRLSVDQLDKARNSVRHPIMRGWLDLNYLRRISANNSQKLNRNIKRWQGNFPRHPASARATRMIRNTTVTPYRTEKVIPVLPLPKSVPVRDLAPLVETTKPTTNITTKPTVNIATQPLPSSLKQVVAILPLTGALASVGQSLLSGIKKAQRDYATNVKIRILDSNSDDINVLYRKAISKGDVDFVIGPFSKVKIAELSKVSSLPVNTLALNYMAKTKAPTGLYQFGLAPEDETVQIARRLLARGYKKIAIVVPDSSWGRRLRNSFADAYVQGDGVAVITINYSKDSSRYRDITTALLKKKDKIDAIFLAASPSQARAIQPLLHEGKLKELPVYATSHIYTGLANQYQNVGLEGITYTEIPWILEVNKKGLPQTSKFPRLKALGMDALMVAKGISTIKSGSVLNGRTGRIGIKRDGTLHRELKWAKFNGGSPTSIP